MIEISSLCQFKALNDRSVIVIADLSYNQWLIDRDWSKLESPDRDKSYYVQTRDMTICSISNTWPQKTLLYLE